MKKRNFQNKKKINQNPTQNWIYRQSWDFFGFVDTIDPITEEKVWYYVHDRNKDQALDGDEVSFYTKEFKWKKEAVITDITKRSSDNIVWVLEIHNEFGFVVPEKNIYKKELYFRKNLKFKKYIFICFKLMKKWILN